MKAFFITGTDTGVGKTVVTSAVAAYCSLKRHLDVGVMKPFESGLPVRAGDHPSGDALFLKEASGSRDALSVIRPYAFEAPLAPEAASEREHVEIDIAVVDAMYRRLAQSHDVLLVEGAGGILVPIRRDFFFVDLAKELENSRSDRIPPGAWYDQSYASHVPVPSSRGRRRRGGSPERHGRKSGPGKGA